MKLSILFLLVLFVVPCFSQSDVTGTRRDSINQITKSDRPLKWKITALQRLSEKFSPQENKDSELALLNALALAQALNDSEDISKCYHLLGELYRRHSDYFKAIRTYKHALHYRPDASELYLQLGICYLRVNELDSAKTTLLHGLEVNTKNDKHTEASIYNALGNVVKDQDDYKQALEYYLKSTTLFEQLNNKAGLTQSISNIGNIQYLLQNYDAAMQYATRSLRYAEESGVESSVAYSYRLMGRILRKQGKLDEARQNYGKAIAIYYKLGARRDISETHYNTGNIYFEMQDFASAIQQYQSALAIQRTIPDYYNMAYSYSAIGQAYFELQSFGKSLQYLDSAQSISKAHDFSYVILDVLDYKSNIFTQQNRFKEANDLRVEWGVLKDSRSQEENRQAARELEAKYASQKKEEEIKTLKAETDLAALRLQQQITQRNYLIGLSVLSLALVAVLFNRYKLKTKTAQQLQELDKMRSRFFTYLSHEFRTPLTLISGPLEQRLQRSKDPEEEAELRLMLNNSRHLAELIDQLLDLAKVESGHMKLQLAAGDINSDLKLIAASFVSLAEHKGVSFNIDINVDATETVYDSDKLVKVLYNLLSNAFKFTETGGQVWFTATLVKNKLCVSVKDTGVGIPEEKAQFIFDRFYQIDDSMGRTASGSGIGLALSRELAILHKGDLILADITPPGCEFMLTIPISRTDYSSLEIHEQKKAVVKTPPSQRTIESHPAHENNATSETVVLVAEDNFEMRAFLSGVLAHNYRVITVTNGQEALAKALEFVPDLIVTDVMMPVMDGMALCKEIKGHAATSHIPVVMLTARADAESKMQGLETGADDYLAKPFESRELIARINNLIEQRKLLQGVFREQVIWHPKELHLKQPDELFMERFIGIIQREYCNAHFGVEQLCLDIGLSRMQLNRKLKAITGKSPGDFLRSFRIEQAKQIIISGATVSEAAFACGFNNLSNFSKVFKDQTGVLPSEFLSHQKQPG